jgi:hypothetical protein
MFHNPQNVDKYGTIWYQTGILPCFFVQEVITVRIVEIWMKPSTILKDAITKLLGFHEVPRCQGSRLQWQCVTSAYLGCCCWLGGLAPFEGISIFSINFNKQLL